MSPGCDPRPALLLVSPSSLLFAVSASFRAAPLPVLTLARIDEIDIAIRCTTLSNPHALDVDKQQYTALLDLDRDLRHLSVGATLFVSGPRFEEPASTQRLGWKLQPNEHL